MRLEAVVAPDASKVKIAFAACEYAISFVAPANSLMRPTHCRLLNSDRPAIREPALLGQSSTAVRNRKPWSREYQILCGQGDRRLSTAAAVALRQTTDAVGKSMVHVTRRSS